jgi:diguanylate cyclase (GGDEF)-like protein
MTLTYALALVFLAAGVTTAHLFLRVHLAEAEAKGGTINLSGRQRTMVHRIALLAREYADAPTPAAAARAADALAAEIARYERAGEALRGGLRGNGGLFALPGPIPDAGTADAEDIEREREFAAAARRLLVTDDASARVQLAGQLAAAATGPMLEHHDALTRARQREAEQAVAFLLRAETGALLLTLLTLGAEAALIFAPLTRGVARRTAALEQTRAALRHSAHHDELTGLPNRRMLRRRARDWQTGGESPDVFRALLHVDLDHFKEVNDTLGHAAGDAVLRHAGTILGTEIRRGAFAARVGGDEFVVVDRTCSSQEEVLALAERLIARLSEPFTVEGQTVRIGASIGIAIDETNGRIPLEQLLLDADLALYESKRRGRGVATRFEPDHREHYERLARSSARLRDAVERGAIRPWYQPVLRRGTLVALDVEPRWHEADGLVHPPSHFAALAESEGVADRIFETVLSQAVGDFRHWARDGLAPPALWLRLTSSQARDPNFARRAIGQLMYLGMPPERLCLVLPEHAFAAEDGRGAPVVEQIAAYRRFGVHFAIDDFGTGNSLVGRLCRQPRFVRLAHMLTDGMEDSAAMQRVTAAVVNMGADLGVEVTACRVDDRRIHEALVEAGCDVQQGEWLAPAAPGDQTGRWLLAAAACDAGDADAPPAGTDTAAP